MKVGVPKLESARAKERVDEENCYCILQAASLAPSITVVVRTKSPSIADALALVVAEHGKLEPLIWRPN